MLAVLQPLQAVLAVTLGVLGAIALFIPFVVISYRARGHVGLWWVIGWVATAVYLAALVSYTLLPLPSGTYTCRGIQLQLGTDLLAAVRRAHGVGDLLRSMAVWQLTLNVVLFIPLGMLLRLRHQRGWAASLLVGFAVSLAIELTQLTGNWGIYPCAYRVFDVDDLAANTLGAVVGSIFALVFAGSRRPDAPTAASPVTVLRRLLGMICDGLLVLAVPIAVGILLRLVVAILAPAGTLASIDLSAQGWFVAVQWLPPLLVQTVIVFATGGTFGDWAVQLRGVNTGSLPTWVARMLRLIAGSGGVALLGWVDAAGATSVTVASLLGWAASLLWALIVASIIAVFLTPDRRGLAGLVSGVVPRDRRVIESAAAPEGARPAGQPRDRLTP